MKTQVDSEMYSSLRDNLNDGQSRVRLTSFEDIIGKQRNVKADSLVRTKPTVRSYICSVAVVLFFIAQVVMNVLASESFGSFGGESSGQISKEQPTFLTPDGLTYRVWCIIYLFQGLFSIYQFIPCFQNSHAGVSRARFLVIVLYIVNCMWLVVFSYKLYWLTFLLTLVMDVTLVMIYRRMKINYGAVLVHFTQGADMLLLSAILEDPKLIADTQNRLSGSRKKSRMLLHPWPVKLLCFVGFSTNISWLAVASMVRLLVATGSEGWHKEFTTRVDISPANNSTMVPAVTYVNGSPDFAIMAVCLLATIACVLAIRNCDVPYALVTIWALWGIRRAQGSKAPEGFPEVAMSKPIVDWTTAMMAIVSIAVMIGLVKAIVETASARAADSKQPEGDERRLSYSFSWF